LRNARGIGYGVQEPCKYGLGVKEGNMSGPTHSCSSGWGCS
jgi:hypothetical protein